MSRPRGLGSHPPPLPEGEGREGQNLPRVRRLAEVEDIRLLLDTRRAYAAAVFGYLEPRLFSRTEWFEGLVDGARALLLLVSGTAGGLMYAQGDTAALEAVLQQATPVRRTYFTFEAAHEPLVRRWFILRHLQRLVRMQIRAETLTPVPSRAGPLGLAEVDRINDLYSTDSGAWISRRQFGEQVYYGIWESGKLVSVAGTQAISRRYGVAVVANVMTHRDYRDRGYATECVSALTQALLREVQDVVLNVAPENAPAIRVYQRLGYEEAYRLAEGWAFWRGRTGWDRLLARVYDWVTR